MAKVKHMVRYTLDEVKAKLARGEDQTDWNRLKATTEEEIEASIAADDDDVDYPPDWPDGVIEGLPQPVEKVSVPVDADVVRWFRSLGPPVPGAHQLRSAIIHEGAQPC